MLNILKCLMIIGHLLKRYIFILFDHLIWAIYLFINALLINHIF